VNITFLLDANPSVGYGHLGRCINIAHHLQSGAPDAQIGFCGDLDQYAQRKVELFNFQATSGELQYRLRSDIMVVDSYLLSESDVTSLAGKFQQSIFVDDFGHYSYEGASTVLNFTANAERRYAYRADASLLGLRYYPVDPEMIRLREQQLLRTEINNVLIFFGGKGGREGSHARVLREIDARVQGKSFRLLLPKGTRIMLPCSGRNEFTSQSTARHIKEHFEWCDALISGGGLMKYESGFSRIYNGSVASNAGQLQDSLVMHDLELSQHLGFLDGMDEPQSVREFHKKLDVFFNDLDVRAAQYMAQTQLFDTHSGASLAEEILHVT
jgi:spore coat polysaccharide biosynthesis predicted glycosyltransferase SpsG